MKLQRLIGTVCGVAMLAGGVSQSVLATSADDFNFETTMDLYRVCAAIPESDDYVPSVFACRGFIEAAVQYHDAVSDRKQLKRLICYPKTATVADGRRAFLAWVEGNKGNSAWMKEQPVVGLVRSLADKYPCK